VADANENPIKPTLRARSSHYPSACWTALPWAPVVAAPIAATQYFDMVGLWVECRRNTALNPIANFTLPRGPSPLA
jgi:hypothetical protein